MLHSSKTPSYCSDLVEGVRGLHKKAVKEKQLPFESIQRQDPWHRLHLNRTLTNFYKTIYFEDKPQSSLDYHLRGDYDHFRQFNSSTKDIVKQHIEHKCNRRFFIREQPFEPTKLRPVSGHLLCTSIQKKREILESAKLAIDRPHIMHANHGFSVKRDGGHFSI